MTASPPRRPIPGGHDRRGPQGHPAPERGDAASSGRSGAAAVIAVRRLFGAETGNYFLLLGTTLFLVALGLVMVLSSSSVTSYTESGGFFGSFSRQALFAAIGLPLMLLASRARAAFWKRWAGIAVVGAVALQFLTVATPLGVNVNGNRNWIAIGSIQFQPSELVKLALVIWLALILSRKQGVLGDWRELAIPIAPVTIVAVGLVMAGGDLGTVVILAGMILGTLFFAGAKLTHLALTIAVGAVGAVLLAFGTLSRQDRIATWQAGCGTSDDQLGYCWQTLHGWWALASGGVFGEGLGNSKAKWNWLPEADNDFIFAIIGEELGLIGALLVLVLFIIMVIAFVRIIRANPDPFAKIATSAVMVWLAGQAFVNIAVVLGVLPVLGVPLPLISSGGTALISSMIAIGVVLSFARKPVPRPAARADAHGRVDS
ncbi:cell division-specific peptidoglycan biosynthesis regulator FtsW [Homoserinimonas aerilata]|uniref:Probable peptidoglycan glycosyltransferase FtsW n=1 Tax=Homoserinimonas aerilata TaxID=1162970 RepID=A0A542YJ83_9MICO|nr:putative lipid II flippase FtsW [Homoserinimonas aerilata]TQL48150.1 cell division-specific peptidoglycan biosynthesis regulator FtsW [Homoserinimonas aerilata]